MGKVVGGMTQSIDGFVSDIHGDGSRLYPDMEALRASEVLQEEIRTTGAILMGRHSYEMADPDTFAESYEYQVPIFVLTHNVPAKKPKETERLTVTFLTEPIESAIAKAKAAAADKNVLLIGVTINQQCINAGLCDELHMGYMPVLLGDGLRLLEHIDLIGFTLKKIRLFEAGERTDIWFRIVKPET